MGSFKEMITLKNAGDLTSAARGYIKASAVREIGVNALVDTGAVTLIINEATRIALGLNTLGSRPVDTANGLSQMCNIAESVMVCWGTRYMVCQPLVFPSGDILLGAIPLEDMDLMVDIVEQRLVGRHGNEIRAMVV
jgi:hypothetical protein